MWIDITSEEGIKFKIKPIKIMDNFKLSKNFRFEAAHRLVKYYKGKCSSVHGHSWTGCISVVCSSLDQYDMAIDFSHLGTFVKAIEEQFDHATLVFKGDKPMMDFLTTNVQKYAAFDANPTCEIIAKDIYKRARIYFSALSFVKAITVTIHETCTSECVYTNTNEKETVSES